MKSLAHFPENTSKYVYFLSNTPSTETGTANKNAQNSRRKPEIGSPEELQQKKDALTNSMDRFHEEWLLHGEKIRKETGRDVNQDGGVVEFVKYQNTVSLVRPRRKGISWQDIVEDANRINSDKINVRENIETNNPQIWNLLQTAGNINKVARHLETTFGKLSYDNDQIGVWINEKTGKTEIHFKRDGEEEYVIPFRDIK